MSGALLPGRKIVANNSRNRGAKNLRALLAGLTTAPSADVGITDLTLDSRNVQPGALFLALPGMRTHGIGFAAQVVNAGAAAIAWEPAANVAAPKVPPHVALVAVPQLSALVGAIADRFFDSPSGELCIAGVTGTNGKTTTAYVIATALAKLQEPAAYAGTIGYGRVGALRSQAHTTPDCVSVHRGLAELRDDGVRFLGMEVSSHALAQQRVDGVRFTTAVFTNLTHDHLDYHGTFDAYGAAKAKLFAWPELQHAVINADDAFGQSLLATHAQSANVVAYSRTLTSSLAHGGGAQRRQLFARNVAAGPVGLVIQIDGSWGTASLHSRFIGEFNVENLLAALGVLLSWEVPLPRALAALEQCVAPPGRMETFTAPAGPVVIVDYAHTPDALEKALLAVRKHCQGRIVCVFGCGGERDGTKRPLMGAIAERYADAVIVTDDNPRGEDGAAIARDIVAGTSAPQRIVVERDRARAIEQAIREARSGDAVLIAGKGHEDYQIVGTQQRHFSDREVAQAALERSS
jgi:UDP-N-acetylmuramoyl-L-alanyl-D-glutamate--2,6-diaminopimelate ligase